jgi:molecular chaperone HtpG
MEDCQDLVPEYFRFVKGVVDAPDLNLNISREILQQDRLVRNIRRNLAKKLFEHLEKMDQEKYEKFYNEFGPILKIGIHTDPENRKKISELIRYQTSRSGGNLVSLKEYVANMKPDQKEIYYITGDDISAMINSPLIEKLKEKDYEVLLMADPVDEWVVESLAEYDGKPLKSAEKGDLALDEADEGKKQDYTALFGFIKSKLQDKIKEVRASSRLKDSVSCLSGDAHDMSAYMEKILQASGQNPPQVKRVLELNVNHPALVKIKDLYEGDKNDPLLASYSELLLDMAIVGEGGKLENPSRFSKTIGELMAGAIDSQ